MLRKTGLTPVSEILTIYSFYEDRLFFVVVHFGQENAESRYNELKRLFVTKECKVTDKSTNSEQMCDLVEGDLNVRIRFTPTDAEPTSLCAVRKSIAAEAASR